MVRGSGFGTAALVIDRGVTPEDLLQDFLGKLSIEDLETMRAILHKYSPYASEMVESGEFRLRYRPPADPADHAAS